MGDEIELVEYDAAWPARFAAEADLIRTSLGSLMVAIEHVGSTAVPGLPAKPIIDIDVTLARFERDRESAVVALEAIGYSYWRANPDPGHLFFVKGLPPAGAGRTHHVHAFDGPAEYGRRAFRDHLRMYPDDARRYVALKRELATRFRTDRDAYTAAKTDFVREVLGRGRG